MAGFGEVMVRIVIANWEAGEALRRAYEAVAEASMDAPWSDQLREAEADLRYVFEHLKVRHEDGESNDSSI